MSLQFPALLDDRIQFFLVGNDLCQVLFGLVLRVKVNHLRKLFVRDGLHWRMVDVEDLEAGAVQCFLVDCEGHEKSSLEKIGASRSQPHCV